MFFRRKRPREARFRLPEGRRVYAIGDVHGREDLLREMLARIAADDASRAAADSCIILLGDLIDRGPRSREVIALVRTMCEGGTARLVKGNHEEIFVAAARGDRAAAKTLLAVGGEATLRSFGLDDAAVHAGSFGDLAALLVARVPREDVDFLDAAPAYILIGDYLFTHAGIEPGVAIDEQSEHDMRWIRERFTASDHDHGVRVVHGHTVSAAVEVRENRIGVDTGAHASGRLSAVGIDGGDVWLLEADGTAPPC